MKLVFKYLFKYDFNNKNLIRTCMLFFSITISATLFVGTFLTKNNLVTTYEDYITKQFGNYNVKVEPKQENQADYISVDQNIKDVASFSSAQMVTSVDNKKVTIVGMEKQQLDKNNLFQLIKKEDSLTVQGENWCYISINTANQQNLKLNDTIELESDHCMLEYRIAGIVSNDFVFANDNAKHYSIIIERDTLLTNVEKNQLSNYQYMNVDAANLDNWILQFNRNNQIFTAMKTYDRVDVDLKISLVSSPLYFMLAIVIVCSVFIILSSYKIVISDRLQVFGVFLSQGISHIKLRTTLIVECMVLGGMAGVVGGILGNQLSGLIMHSTNPLKEYDIELTSSFHVEYVLLAVAFAITFSIISALLPILSMKKCSLKDILTQTLESKEEITKDHFVIGIVLVLILIICHFLHEKIGILSIISLVALFVGTILCIPIICNLMTYLIRKVHKKREGIGLLVSSEISASKITLNSIKVLTATLVIIFMLNAIGNEMSSLVREGYRVIDFDIYLDVQDEHLEEIHNKVVNDKFLVHETGTISTFLDGDSKKMVNLIYVDTDQYKIFEQYIHFDNKNKELDALNASDNGIILSKQIAKLYQVEKGDTIQLVTTEGYQANLKVLSICDPKMWRGGNYNIITGAVANSSFGIIQATNYYISLDMNEEKAVSYYKQLLNGYDVDVYTKEELVQYEEQNLKQIANMMSMLSNAILIFGLFAVGGNALVSAVYRKKEMRVLKVLGLEEQSSVYLLVIEKIYIVLISFLIAIPIAGLAILYASDFMNYLNFEMNLAFPFNQTFLVFICVLIGYIMIGLLSSSKYGKSDIREIY